MPDPLSEKDVNGLFFNTQDGKAYRMISFCAKPTATFELVEGYTSKDVAGGLKPHQGGAVGSPIVTKFVRLKREDQ